MRFTGDTILTGLDAIADTYPGTLLELFTGNPAASLGTAPAGTKLAGLTIPTPSHGAGAYNASTPAYEAALAGAWQDSAADASGTPGCFTIKRGSTIICDGTVGASGSGKDMIVTPATLSLGAPFSVTRFTLRIRVG